MNRCGQSEPARRQPMRWHRKSILTYAMFYRKCSGKELQKRFAFYMGGSMKPDNAKGLLAQPDVDGGLIGGASLTSRAFCGIVEAALELSD